jgi:hypothetical protein
MRAFAIVVLMLALAGAAAAQSLEPTAPVKAPATADPSAPPSSRQGGDTVFNAFPIPYLPFDDTGTTAGYADDYAVMCPYGNWAPDVVYRLVPTVSESIDIDLCGSGYDTLILVFDANLSFVACNDDYYVGEPCGMYVSRISALPVVAGETYYIMVDGYGGSFGEYQLRVESDTECIASCLPGEAPEGEPPLLNDQPNGFNDGCGGEPGGFQELPGDANGAINVCGVSGWFHFGASDYRDTDWFTVTVGPGGVVHAEFFAEWPTYLFHLAPTDCNTVSVAQQVTSSCTQVTMDVVGAPGEVIWLWTGPTTFISPTGENPYEFDYDLNLTGLEPVVATEAASWGSLKSLYR